MLNLFIDFFDVAKAESFIGAKTGFFNDPKTDFFNPTKLNISISQEVSIKCR